MKSRFGYGMFAGFALACLFFFFFLFFFPNVFRTLTVKKSPNYANPVAMTQHTPYANEVYVPECHAANPEAPPAELGGYNPEGYAGGSPNGEYIPVCERVPNGTESPYELVPGAIAYDYPNQGVPHVDPASPYPPVS